MTRSLLAAGSVPPRETRPDSVRYIGRWVPGFYP
jgi:hypothetical protein